MQFNYKLVITWIYISVLFWGSCDLFADPLQIQPIAEIKQTDSNGVPLLLGQQVMVSGEVTVTTQWGISACIQDSTAGVVIYDSYFAGAVSIGDSVVVRGVVDQYNGLTELKSISLIEQSKRSPQLSPILVTCSQLAAGGLNSEQYEGMLVRINDVHVNTSKWTVTGSGANYTLSDGSGNCEIRIDKDTDIANTLAPSTQFDVIGVVTQFDYSSPYFDGYQLLPRFAADIITGDGPVLTKAPLETEIRPDAISLEWETATAATGIVRYGLTEAYEIDSLTTVTVSTIHRITLSNLTPATMYHVQVGAVDATGTTLGSDYIVSTASPEGSSGQMLVYFTRGIDSTVASSQTNVARGNVDVEQRLIERIRAAQSSIDVCYYSWNLQGITDALIDAFHNRVRIRFIYDAGHSNQYQIIRLKEAGIPAINSAFGNNSSQEINHNKFVIFDAHHDDDPNNDWVWTGSANMIRTDSLGVNAMQNVIVIQDQALARAYTAEFNEMWGSNGGAPDPEQARFSANKTDNTPHRFNIAGSLVELYFSPSDQQTEKIIHAIQTADYSIRFCILAFTRIDIKLAMLDKFRTITDFTIQGIFDKDVNESSQYFSMHGEGDYAWDPPADVYLDREPGVLHHKYMLIDADHPESDPIVITGSANWSTNAEKSNDENTLIIHNANVANQYLQEFMARYQASARSNSVAFNENAEINQSFTMEHNFPNPFNGSTVIPFQLSSDGKIKLDVYDINGRHVKRLVDQPFKTGIYQIPFDANGLTSGVYFVRLTFAGQYIVRKITHVQ